MLRKKKEQLFCLLLICQPVEIKTFSKIIPLLAKAWLYSELCLCVQFPAVASYFPTTGGRSHLTDRALSVPRKVIVFVKRIFIKRPKSEERGLLIFLSPTPQAQHKVWDVSISHCSIGTFSGPKSHLHSKMLTHKRKILSKSRSETLSRASTPSRGLVHPSDNL